MTGIGLVWKLRDGRTTPIQTLKKCVSYPPKNESEQGVWGHQRWSGQPHRLQIIFQHFVLAICSWLVLGEDQRLHWSTKLTVSKRECRRGAEAVKVAVQTLKGADFREGYTRLHNLVWGARNDRIFPWLWLESHPLADQMHRWVLVTEDQEVVGHLAAVPQFYRIKGQRIVAHTPATFGVLPQYGFHALSLMRTFFRTCKNCVSCDHPPETIAVETRLGAEEVGKLQYATTLLDATRMLNSRLSARIPALVPKLLTRGLRALDAALSSGFGGNLKVEVLEGLDATFDELFESVAAVVPCVPEKDAAFLRWRYGPGSPQSPVTILGVRDEETLLGYAALRATAGGDYSYLLDLTTLPGRHDVAWSLLRDAIRRSARAGVHIVRYRFIESPTSARAKDLWRLGFILRNSNRHTLLVKFADRDLHEVVCAAANWSYVSGDGEASFWVR